MARFDALIFDAGGVLVVPTPEVLGPSIERFGGDGSTTAIERAHYAGMRAQDLHSSDRQSWQAYAVGFVRSTGVLADRRTEAADAVFAEIDTQIDLWRWPLRASVATLRHLALLGVPLAVVSNAEGQIADTLAREGVCQVGPGLAVTVEVVVDSHLVGVSKPDPAIFGFALKVLGTDPGRTAYIGDSIAKDVVGARNAGLCPLHLDPYGDHPDAPHERISSLADLIAFVS